MGEDFAISEETSCALSAAERLLTDPREPAPQAEDLLVVKVELTCHDRAGRPVRAREALPEQALVQLVHGEHPPIAPSLRTRVSEHAPDAWVFEVQPGDPTLPAPRQFSARTGEPLGPVGEQVGRLSVTLEDRQISVSLRKRELDAAFDAWLADVVKKLASEGRESHAPLARARALYARIVARFQPRVVTLRKLEPEGDAQRVTLAFEGATAREAPDPVAELTLLARRRGDTLSFETLLAEAGANSVLRCGDDLEALEQRIERAFHGAKQPGECNALGVILPGACDQVDEGLLADALEVRARCVLHRSLASTTGTRAAPDFQLTLRRGLPESGLDRDPRYVLAIHPGGQVVFHGRHWVSSTERRDGRTSESALTVLLSRFDALEWFTRRGGEWDPERCSPEEDLGNVITLHARGKERMVVDREGCRGGFTARELAGLVEAAELAAGVSAWTGAKPRYADQGVQVWNVSAD